MLKIFKKKSIYVLAFLLLFLFFLLPILKLIVLSFISDHGLVLSNYSQILKEKTTWNVIQNTFEIVIGATLVSVVLGTAIAWLTAYYELRYKLFFHFMAMMPFIIPSYIVTLAWTQLMVPTSIFAQFLHLIFKHDLLLNMYSRAGMIFIMGFTHYPLVYLLTVGVFRKIPAELEMAARTSGASMSDVYRKITLPLSLPGIASGGLLAFLASIDNFGIPAFLGIPAHITVLSTYIYQQIVGFGPSVFGRAAVLSLILSCIVLMFGLLQWQIQRGAFQLEGAYESEESRYSLGRKKVLVEVLLIVFFVLTNLVPLITMADQSLIKAVGLTPTWHHLTLNNYRFVFLENDEARNALFDSLSLAFITTFVCMVIGTLIAYVRFHSNSKWVQWVESVISLPYAIPGIVLSLALIYTWMQPLPGWYPHIYGTLTILIIAYIVRFMILQVRGSMTAFSQLDHAVEEAARAGGANLSVRWRKILLPILKSGLISGGFFVFVQSLTELTVSSLLWSQGSQTIGVVIFNFEQSGYSMYSTAFSSVIVFIILVGLGAGLLLQHLSKKRKGSSIEYPVA